MSKILTKICGIDRPEILQVCIDEGATFAGFVFFPPSPRHLSPEKAADIASVRLPNHKTQLVGLFVNPHPKDIETVLNSVDLDYIQLHGNETPHQVQAFRKEFGKTIIKAMSVSSQYDLETSYPYNESTDFFIFDSKPPISASRPGGVGLKFDWSLMKAWTGSKPWMLAGGLTPLNLHLAFEKSGSFGFDVSSHVESSLGIKSVKKVQDFIKAACALEKT